LTQIPRDSIFNLRTDYEPMGDQPEAIKALTRGLKEGKAHQTLLGVTGSGKTFTIANVIAQVQRPTLVLAHNKTLAAQLYSEFKEFFPENAVEYFVSYYDYYQPEAYIPSSDTYIEKDSSINDEIDKLRHRATRSVLERRDVIVVSSVSCIYGIGDPEEYNQMLVEIGVGDELSRDEFLHSLVEIQYRRNDVDFTRGKFRVRGDTVDVFPPSENERAFRIEWFGDEVDGISVIDPLRGKTLETLKKVILYPASHYVTREEKRKKAMQSIRAELRERLPELESLKKHLEAKRLSQRTLFDLEMMEEIGFCNGIENYSRHLTGRKPGEPPPTLIDYFPDDFLFVIDESHITVSQVGGMYRGDRARKMNLVEHGFRLPSALDNRPLNFQEFEQKMKQTIYVSATPAAYELEHSGGEVIEQIIRPTGLLDPEVEVRPTKNQVDDLLDEIHRVVEKKERILVTTLTKKFSEDLTSYLQSLGVRVRYLHSDIDTLERVEILRGLRLGEFDVLIGINLLREGLDLPEVSLVAILDADKEGFLRSERSLIQTIGRAARNDHGKVILYGDKITNSMEKAISETKRRRTLQEEHNQVHGITPQTIKKSIRQGPSLFEGGESELERSIDEVKKRTHKEYHSLKELESDIDSVKMRMLQAAKSLDFEGAAKLRDELSALQKLRIEI